MVSVNPGEFWGGTGVVGKHCVVFASRQCGRAACIVEPAGIEAVAVLAVASAGLAEEAELIQREQRL